MRTILREAVEPSPASFVFVIMVSLIQIQTVEEIQ